MISESEMTMSKSRNHVATVATFRNSAGSMKHKCQGRGGSRNPGRDYLDDYLMPEMEKESRFETEREETGYYSRLE